MQAIAQINYKIRYMLADIDVSKLASVASVKFLNFKSVPTAFAILLFDTAPQKLRNLQSFMKK